MRILLSEKNLVFETVPVDLANPSRDFLEVNPNLRIPALSDGAVHLFESNLILDYLLSNTPPGSVGTPPLGAAMVRPRHKWDDSKTLMTIETTLDSGLNLFQFSRGGIGPEQAPYLGKEHERIQNNLDWLEKRATPEGFVPGEFSILDLNMICTLEWADFRKPFEWRGRPNLEALVAFHGKRESIRSTRPA